MKKVVVFLASVFVWFSLLTPVAQANGEEWLIGWHYRRSIIIPQAKVSTNLTDFPLYVHVSADEHLGDYAQTDGDDIRFTAADGATLLKFEKESWSGGAGTNATADYWVKTDLTHATSTVIYLYYGNADATSGESTTDVWDSSFRGVWHMNNNAGNTTVSDSTTNANHVTAQRNTSSLTTSGQTGSGLIFNGTSDFLRKTTFTNSPSTQLTLCSWLNTTSANAFLFQQGRSLSSYVNEYVFNILPDGKISFWDNDGELFGFPETDNSSSTSLNDGAWHYACFAKNGTSGTYYLDGVANGTITASQDISYAAADFVIGKDYRDNSRFFSGTLDELSVSATARSSAWIAAAYANQKTPTSFYTLGSAEDNYGTLWLDGWNYRRQITINESQVSDLGGANYTNFPLLISLSGLTNVNADGSDIRFTAADGATLLAQDIESYSSGTLLAWVKIPSLDYNDNTIIYLYSGNESASTPAATATNGSQAVWSNGYVSVYHLQESGTNPTVLDTTNNANHSTSQAWTPTTGKFLGGGSFNGSSQAVNIASNAGLNPATITVSAWVKADVNNKWQYPVTKGGQWHFGRDSTGKYYLGVWNSTGTNVTDAHSTATASSEQWEYIVFTYDASAAKYYVNSSLVIDDVVSGNLYTTTNLLSIGSQNGDGNYWDGLIDEVRIASTPRSVGWITTEYNNQNTPASFLTSATIEVEPTPTPTVTPTPTTNPTPTSVQTVSSNSSAATSTTVSTTNPPSCNDRRPVGRPDLFQITTTQTQATLYFTPVDNLREYFISYSTSSQAEEHGVQVYLDSQGVQSYTIKELAPATTYYFKVRAQNGCMAGEWSNIGSSHTQSQSTGFLASTLHTIKKALTPEKKITVVSKNLTPKKSTLCSYIVNTGDSLWSIAQSQLGEGRQFSVLQELNQLSDTTLNVGQKLALPCNQKPETVAQAQEEKQQKGISLSVLVQDNEQQPLEGVLVTLHSKVQIAKTNRQGIAKFRNVEKGEHRVILAYQGYRGEQALKLNGKSKNQTLTLKVEMNSGFSSPSVLLVIGGLLSIILALMIALWRPKR